MKVFGSYLKNHIREIFIVLLLLAEVAILLFFKDLLSEDYLLYIAIGIAALWLITFLTGLGKFSKKDKVLTSSSNSDEYINQLPVPTSAIEADYQNLLKQVYEEKVFAQTVDERIYSMKDVNLDRVIRSSVQDFADCFAKKQLTFKYKSVIKRVEADEIWISYVIKSIIKNALDSTDKGGIGIYLKDEHTLCIEDTGKGIDSEKLKTIFSKNSEVKDLYLCNLACEKMGIKLFAESEPGQGTKMMLRFKQ